MIDTIEALVARSVSPGRYSPCSGLTNDNDAPANSLATVRRQHIQRIALLALIAAVALACVLVLALLLALEAGSADARTPAATPVSGIVSIADGDPFTIIRQSAVYSGSKGVAVQSGDFIETQPGALLVIGLTGGSLLGIGPSSQVYILQRAEIPTLIVLRGWVKADIRGSAAVPALRVIGTRLGFQSQQAVVLIHATNDRDALFDEQGSATLLLREEAATRTDRLTQPNQFSVRADRKLVGLGESVGARRGLLT